MRHTFFTLLSLSTQLQGIECFWRMICDKAVVTARIDPIVSPGSIAGHTHSITGASNIGYDTTYEDLRNSQCTTCQVTQDKSAYWVPQLYYVHENGRYESVGLTTGITTYYLQRGPPGPAGKILAIPNGLRMIAGDPFRRSYNASDVAQRAIGYSCLGGVGYTKSLTGITNCPNGLRQEIFFPNCWDGINLDSADHSSHMAYSGDDGNGACPASHPHKLISLFFEVMWSIDYWKDQWWNGTAPPFVFAQGDATGYGSHGDFMSGWDQDFLQTAVDTCLNGSGLIQDCPVFDIDFDAAGSCKWAGTLQTTEDVQGQLTGLATLPGCNPVTYGPAEAPIHPAVCPDGVVPSALALPVVSSSQVLQSGVQSPSTGTTSTSSAASASKSGALIAADARTLTTTSSTSSVASLLASSTASTASSVASVLTPRYSNTTRSTSASTSSAVVADASRVLSVQIPTTLFTVSASSTPLGGAFVKAAGNQIQPAVSQVSQASHVPNVINNVDSGAAQMTQESDSSASPAGQALQGQSNPSVVSDVGAQVNAAQGADVVVNVITRISAVTEFITITSTLYGESNSPYVQLYVLPASAAGDYAAAQGTANNLASQTPAPRTSTIYETTTQTVSASGVFASMAALPNLNGLPSMGTYQNTTTQSNLTDAASKFLNGTRAANVTSVVTQFVTMTA